jgi:hypothetical protein
MKTSILNSVFAIATSSLLISSSLLIISGSSVGAKQPKHKVGFIKSKVDLQVGDCGYRISGSKSMKGLVFYAGYSGILVNIDGRDLNLTQVAGKSTKNSKKFRNQVTFKSGMFTVKTDFVDTATGNEYERRDKGTIYFNANDGWKTKLVVECRYDGGG